MSSVATTGRIASIGGALTLLIGLLTFASPAQAAIVVNLSAVSTTVTVGDDVELSWTSTDAVTLIASGAWSGSKAMPGGTESIPTTTAGTFTYTLVATDAGDAQDTDSVTVVVENVGITPNAVTFPDPCTVVVPETDNVHYYVEYGDGDVDEIDADTYDGADFDNGGDPVRFFAETDPGFDFADGAVTEWDYTAGEECFVPEADLVDTTTSCKSVTFTNIYTDAIEVAYGDFESEDEDGSFTLAVGDTRTISTSRSALFFAAFAGDLENDDLVAVEFDILEVPQNCGSGGSGGGSKHPTTAPAAGLNG